MRKIIMAEFNEYNNTFKLGDHHYAKQFSQNGYKVLWLSPLYNSFYYFINKDVYMQRKKLHNNVFKEVDNNILCYAPFSPILYGKMPILNSRFVNILSIRCTIPKLSNILYKNDFTDIDILWLSNPKYFYLTKILKYKQLLYRCADDLSQFNNTFKSLLELEREIIRKANKVFVTSRNLLEKKSYLRDDLIYLPNGVDIDDFVYNHYSVPEEFLNDINKKCIYVGAVDEWFDIRLLKYCAETLPEISFYIVGPVKTNIDEIKNCRNIFVVGKRNYKEIPNYLYNSDVAIIPFKINDLTNSISPIKLYEYMSLGLDVVSTNFKEVRYIESPAYIAKSYKEFQVYILQAIKYGNKNRKDKIIFAENNTWKKRFEIVKAFVE